MKMKDQIIDGQVGTIRFTLIFVPILCFVLEIVAFLFAFFYENIEHSARILVYVMSAFAMLLALIYAVVVPILIKRYPQYKWITHLFI